MSIIKISIDPSWNDVIFDVSVCVDSWIRLNIDTDPRTYLMKDPYYINRYAVYVVCGSDEEHDSIIGIFSKEKSNKLIVDVRDILIFGHMKHPIYPDKVKSDSLSCRYYNAIRSWFMCELDKSRSSPIYRYDSDELSSVVCNMKFNPIGVD